MGLGYHSHFSIVFIVYMYITFCRKVCHAMTIQMHNLNPATHSAMIIAIQLVDLMLLRGNA